MTQAPEESSNYSFDSVWQTWIGRRGDVARSMFYMAVRYDGITSPGEQEPNLRLTDDLSRITVRNDAWRDGEDAYMGLLSVLLDWHDDDPVDDLERRRNTVVYLFQGNRNPFVDHPEWVEVIFEGGLLDPDDPNGDQTDCPRAWINELHYDNAGADSSEFVEIAGTAGLDLDGWLLVGYNGNGGRQYRTLPLAGALPDQQNGYGTLAFAFEGLQNGGPDGIALVDPNGAVVEFLSYERRFTAVDGPAADEASADIGVSETGQTAPGMSLQRTGTGTEEGHFRWDGPNANTRGQPNAGQTLG